MYQPKTLQEITLGDPKVGFEVYGQGKTTRVRLSDRFRLIRREYGVELESPKNRIQIEKLDDDIAIIYLFGVPHVFRPPQHHLLMKFLNMPCRCGRCIKMPK